MISQWQPLLTVILSCCDSRQASKEGLDHCKRLPAVKIWGNAPACSRSPSAKARTTNTSDMEHPWEHTRQARGAEAGTAEMVGHGLEAIFVRAQRAEGSSQHCWDFSISVHRENTQTIQKRVLQEGVCFELLQCWVAMLKRTASEHTSMLCLNVDAGLYSSGNIRGCAANSPAAWLHQEQET